ncbi:MAG: FAD-dependent oxidoreductase [Chloroflexota bacterium]
MKVIVVGAGPAGAATALPLARSGVEVALLERETSLERVFPGPAAPKGASVPLHQGRTGSPYLS